MLNTLLKVLNGTVIAVNVTNNEYFSESNINIDSTYGPISPNDPLESVKVILEIISLEESNFNIQKSKVIYSYKDGTSEEKSVYSQDILPKPSKTAILPYWFEAFWFIWIPIIAILLISLILFSRRKRKTR